MQRSPRFLRSACLRFAGAIVTLACALGPADAAVQWHANLEQAKAAAQVSRRPVLILFVATWSEQSINHDNTFLRTEESVALLTACYEPVRIDIDVDKATPARLDVRHVPCACVVDAEERLLARFDCPESSAAFVATAGRAAQDAAVACAGPLPTQASPQAPTQPAPGPLPTSGPAPGPVATTPAVAPSAVPSPDAVPESPAAQGPPAPPAAAALPAGPPTLADAPPAWAPETTTQPIAGTPEISKPAVRAPQVIEPPQTPQPEAERAPGPAAITSSWLAPAPAPAPAAAPGPTPPRVPEPAKKQGGFWATVRKPFGSWLGTAAKTSESVPEVTDIPTTGVPGDDPSSPAPVGLEGYCPVTLVEKGAWAEGRAKWGVRHRGRTYLCAGPEEQRSFRANPDRYAPGLSGDDPVMAFDAGRRAPGQRQYGVSYRAKIYLFSSPDTQAAFRADPQKYAERVQVAEQSAGAATVR